MFLEENPITVPAVNHPDITIMEDYFDSLKQLLKYYIETLKTK